MTDRLVRGTANAQGRKTFIHPGNSSMREVSYGRIRLGAEERRVSFATEGQETGLVCVGGAGEVAVGIGAAERVVEGVFFPGLCSAGCDDLLHEDVGGLWRNL